MTYRDPFTDVPQLDVQAVHEMWRSGEVQIVDVREPYEWEMGHIEGVTTVPLDHLPYRWKELDPDKKWICVCRMGSRSQYAAALLRQAGIDAYNMYGGMFAWKQNDLPMTPPGIVAEH